MKSILEYLNATLQLKLQLVSKRFYIELIPSTLTTVVSPKQRMQQVIEMLKRRSPHGLPHQLTLNDFFESPWKDDIDWHSDNPQWNGISDEVDNIPIQLIDEDDGVLTHKFLPPVDVDRDDKE